MKTLKCPTYIVWRIQRVSYVLLAINIYFFTSLFLSNAWAQTYRFQDAGINDKLPNIEVTKMLQDKYGYMWFGTRNGLVKYDGINVEVFQFPVVNPNRQDRNRPVVVTALSESKNGAIWVGTANGEIGRFDRINNRLTPFKIGPNNKDLYKPYPVIAGEHQKIVEDNLFTQQTTDSIFSQGEVWAIHARDNGNLWVGNHNQSGFFKIETDTNTYCQTTAKVNKVTWYSDNNKTIKIRGRAKHIIEDKNGIMWISGDRGIIEVKPSPFTYQLHQLVADTNHNWLNKFEEPIYLDSIIVMGSVSSSVHIINLHSKKVTNYIEPFQDSVNSNLLFFKNTTDYVSWKNRDENLLATPTKIFFHHNTSRKIWARLHLFDSKTPKYVAFDPNDKTYHDLNIILDDGSSTQQSPNFNLMYQDRSGNIWASNQNGIFKLTPQSFSFQWHKNTADNPKSLLGEQIHGIYPAENDQYWITTNKGLNLWNFESKSFDRFPFPNTQYFINGNRWFQSLTIAHDLLPDKKKTIWVASNLDLLKFNSITSKFTLNEIDLKYFNHPLTCYAIAKDTFGNLWLGYQGRLIYFNPKTKENIDYTFPGHHFLNFISTSIKSLLIDSNEKLWIGTYDKGMFCLDTKKLPKTSETIPMEAFESYEYEGAQPKIIDSKGNLWATSPASGIIKINLATKDAIQYTTIDGLAHNSTFSIVEDNQGKIWIGTFHGLSCFEPNQNSFHNYYQSDGLPTNVINGTKASKTYNGNLLFPTNKGIISFNPEDIYTDDMPPKVVFTSCKVNNQPLEIGKNKVLSKHISLSEKIVLDHDQNDLTLSFSALYFNSPEKNQYAVFMENEDASWRKINNQSSVTYTNLSPGNYIFQVKAANSDEVWAETPTKLMIEITPPLWATWWAYALYSFTFLSLAFAIYRFQLNKKLNENETKRLLELDKFKSKFYTNITHEFRTPLTIILGISESLLEHSDKQITKLAYLLNNNANNLRNLINQLLDLSKIRSKSLTLHLQQSDVFLFLKLTLEPFVHDVKSKQLQFNFNHEPENLFMDFDQEKLRQVIFNLVSNAIKFTHSGSISIKAEQFLSNQKPFLKIEIRDTGIGISTKELEQIFENFYQVDDSATRKYEGSGIGLALTKELITLMEGKITVESSLGIGSTFSIELPITNNQKLENLTPALVHLPKPNNRQEEEIESYEVEDAKSTSSILLIEDNKELQHYLSLLLKEKYKITLANNGAVGIEKAIKYIPDLIVCDVMMPEKDGFEVCLKLKEDERTSHIPIIFLTAKTNLLDRIKGLHVGADAYINKPFNKEELLINIKRCIDLREKLRERYSRPTSFSPTENVAIQANDNFLMRLNNVIEQNLQSANLPIPYVADKMSLSRSQLYRKVHALTGKNASKYILLYRLHIAKGFIENTDKNISEIAFEVGFNDPNYFTRKFNEAFGISPTALRKKLKK